MPNIPLPGCEPEPLMAYLKALGIQRLVAQQKDPEARGAWQAGIFWLDSALDRGELVGFFLSEYRPTPILAPWNGGSGFYDKDKQEAICAIERSTSTRLASYRESIRMVRQLLRRLGVSKKPTGEEAKAALLAACRGELPDNVVPWLDAAYVLTNRGPAYPPLLGTGGNDGRLEFTNNFMQRIVQVLPLTEEESGKKMKGAPGPDWLHSALFGEGSVSLMDASVGQFSPGGVGGPNSTQGFEGTSVVNPWEYILMIEGTVLFAGAAARRLGWDSRGRASYPFTVRGSGVGYGSASEREGEAGRTRGEIWMPLWQRGAALREVAHLLAEGRAQVGRRLARTGVDLARAVAGLGVDRGVTAFQRYGFLRRSGKAYLATPLTRMDVDGSRVDVAQALLEVDPWLERFRAAALGKEAPAGCRAAARRLERALFAACLQASARRVQDILMALGEAEKALARSPKFREDQRLAPLSPLSPQWLRLADDGSAEIRLAASLASIQGDVERKVGPIRCYVEPVTTKGDRLAWTSMGHSASWSGEDLYRDLEAVLERRINDACRQDLEWAPLWGPLAAGLGDIQAFLEGLLDVDRLARLVPALASVRWETYSASGHGPGHAQPAPPDLSRPYALLKLLHLPGYMRWTDSRLQILRGPASAGVAIWPDANFVRLLRAGRLAEACQRAGRRLRAFGLTPLGTRRGREPLPWDVPSQTDARRLAAALIFPVRDVGALAAAVLRPPEKVAALATEEEKLWQQI